MLDTFISEEPGTAGQKLRNARIAMGVKLEDVARTTRIAKGYLIALEEDAYQKLPSETYARGFLRVYANFLGLQGEEILNLYRQNISVAESEELSPANPGTIGDKENTGGAEPPALVPCCRFSGCSRRLSSLW
jgi:cytoskeletal protein RodZ